MQLLNQLLILITGATLFSCNESSAKKEITQIKSDKFVTDNNKVFGTWSMCSINDGKNLMQQNTCRRIKFNHNGTGTIESNSIIAENFIWSLKSPGMKIICTGNFETCTFSDTFYYASIDQTKDRINLQLRHGSVEYYLSK